MPGTHSFLSTLVLALVFFGSTASYAAPHPTPAKDGSAVGMGRPYREGHHYYDYDHDHDLIDLDDDVLGHGLLGVHLRDVASESLSKKEKKKTQKQKKKAEKEAKKNKKNKKKDTKKPAEETITIEEAPKGEEVVEIAVDVDDAHATADAASTPAAAPAEEVLIVTRSEQVTSKSKNPNKDNKTKSKDKQKDKKKDKSTKDTGKKSGKDKTSKTDTSKSVPADDGDSGSGGHDNDDDGGKTLMDHATDIVEGVGSVGRLATAAAELVGV
ncbi:hypothetical protein D9613_002368 [Agrocybe pediades]|uniref:Uncharacterized protein n=1 Tax=Agrocybe pediades TaxID=84607 RepID=A0A8H4R8B9_9AGAR|nr:hypothetical protein D9613_002368 [Agrocybe pediades]